LSPQGPNRDTFVTVSNRDIYEELAKLRADLTAFSGVREDLTDHEARVRTLELASAKLWYVRPVSIGALAAAASDLVVRLVHVM
jgi:hypothetical protein